MLKKKSYASITSALTKVKDNLDNYYAEMELEDQRLEEQKKNILHKMDQVTMEKARSKNTSIKLCDLLGV